MGYVAKIDRAEHSKKAQAAIDQKRKSVEFLWMLDIYKPYINGFVNQDRVCFFEQFGGFWAYQEPEVEAKLHEIEKEYGCKVYAIVHAKVGGDDMWSFLVVTKNSLEWDDLLIQRQTRLYGYCKNKEDDYLATGQSDARPEFQA